MSSPSNEFKTVDIKCPLFKKIKGGTVIVCEGPYDGCLSISLAHQNKIEMKKQCNIFCCDKFCNCEIYRMICDAKY